MIIFHSFWACNTLPRKRRVWTFRVLLFLHFGEAKTKQMALALRMLVGTGKDLFLGRLVDKGSITVFTEFKVLYLRAIWILEHRILALISSQGESSGRFPERSPDATVFAAFMHAPRGNAGPQTPTVSICYQSLGSGKKSLAPRSAVVPPSHLRYCRPLPSPGRSRVARPRRPLRLPLAATGVEESAPAPWGAGDPELQERPSSCGGRWPRCAREGGPWRRRLVRP